MHHMQERKAIGIFFKRRAQELLDLEERTREELKGEDELMEGTVTVGCGEFTAVEVPAEFCRQYREKYPLVQIAIHTATADITYEMMNKGLVDVGLFMEPVNTEGLEYIRITDSDHWVVGLRPDDPLVKKDFIEKEDLIDKPLILPERTGARSLLANWFGKDFHRLHVAYTSNLGTNAGILASKGAGYPVSLEGAGRYWREDLLIQKRLYPEITSNTVVAWRRNIPNSPVVNKFIEEIKAFDGWKN